MVGIAARNGHPTSFWRFTKYGSLVALVTIAVSWLYLWLRYSTFGWGHLPLTGNGRTARPSGIPPLHEMTRSSA